MNTNINLLSPAELSAATGVGRETLRFYEEKGLVVPVGRTAAGYRQYHQAAVEVIGFIKETQLAGFSLKEIDELLQLRTTARNTCGNVNEALTRKMSAIDDEIAALQRKRILIESMVTHCCPSPGLESPCSFVP